MAIKVNLRRRGSGSFELETRKSERPNTYKKKKKNVSLPVFGGKFVFVLKWIVCISVSLLFFFGISLALLLGYNYFTLNTYFNVKTVEIDGLNRLKSREVLEMIDLELGMNSLALSITDMERALARSPWVGEFSVKRVLPDRFEIRVKEREPRYWVVLGGNIYYADEFGAPIAPVTLGDFSSLTTLEVEPGAEYMTGRLPFLMKSLGDMDFPIEPERLSLVRLSASRALEVRLGSGMRLVLGLDDWALNLKHADAVLGDLAGRGELKQAAELKAYGNSVWVARQ